MREVKQHTHTHTRKGREKWNKMACACFIVGKESRSLSTTRRVGRVAVDRVERVEVIYQSRGPSLRAVKHESSSGENQEEEEDEEEGYIYEKKSGEIFQSILWVEGAHTAHGAPLVHCFVCVFPSLSRCQRH